jgi:hypothetical protein
MQSSLLKRQLSDDKFVCFTQAGSGNWKQDYRSADIGTTRHVLRVLRRRTMGDPHATSSCTLVRGRAWLPAPPSTSASCTLTYLKLHLAIDLLRVFLRRLFPGCCRGVTGLRQDIAEVLVALRRRRHSSWVESVSRRSDRGAMCDGCVYDCDPQLAGRATNYEKTVRNW